jgi:hypothetical protein
MSANRHHSGQPEIRSQAEGRARRRTLVKTSRNEFDPQAFLAKVGEGKSVSTFRKNETMFSQGDAADKVFYI